MNAHWNFNHLKKQKQEQNQRIFNINIVKKKINKCDSERLVVKYLKYYIVAIKIEDTGFC